MSKKTKIIYWVSTLWLSLGMLSSGIVQTIQWEEEMKNMQRLGFPAYFMTIIGVWKLFGVLAILLPRTPLLKEWAYAGFFFVSTGAFVSHVVVKDPLTESIGPILLLVLTLTSWKFRPIERKIN